MEDDNEDENEEGIASRISRISRNFKKYDDKSIKSDLKYFLQWVTEHKIFSIFLLILIILGLDKLVRHFSRRY